MKIEEKKRRIGKRRRSKPKVPTAQFPFPIIIELKKLFFSLPSSKFDIGLKHFQQGERKRKNARICVRILHVTMGGKCEFNNDSGCFCKN